MNKLLLVIAVAGLAHADDKKQLSGALAAALGVVTPKADLPQLILIDSETKLQEPFIYGNGSPSNELLHVQTGTATNDKDVGWIAADSGLVIVCGMEGCDKIYRDAAREAEKKPPYHHTALVDHGTVLFIHSGATGKGVGFGADMDEAIDDGAKRAVSQFTQTIGTSESFASTVSTRKDVVMYGTEPNERFVGGAAVKAALKKWNLSLTVHGKLRAGVTKDKHVAWIAADVNARSVKGDTVNPYRLTVVYEADGATWSIVQIHFS
ncbi:MAG: nuclear transport factor 2 family protein [Kofleriaceae bacterium]